MDKPGNTPAPAGRALVLLEGSVARPRLAFFTWQRAALGVSLLAVFGIGAVGTHAAQVAWTALAPTRVATAVDPTTQTLHRLQDEVARLQGSVDTLRVAADGARQDETLRTLKHSVEQLKSDVQQAHAADGSSLQQIAARLDKPDASAKLADIVARLDRIEHEPVAKVDPALAPARIADLTTRLDRIERAAAAPLPTGSIPSAASHPAPAATTSVGRTVAPPARPAETAETKALASKPLTVDAWVVRDVYDGVALVQARQGGLREIGPGEYLPGAGQVRSIERRGRAWVVMTSRGVIGTDTF